MGEKIRQLRHQNNRTQEDLAQALGVTCQAISRWEAGGGCPDVELIPSIANYFGVSIDVLFGFHSSRDRRVGEILARVDSYGIKARSDGPWVEECIHLLREGLAEFPMEERLRIKLADVLCDAEWRRHQEWTYYDEEGYIRHDYDRQRKNVYWAEAVKICENLADTAEDYQIPPKKSPGCPPISPACASCCQLRLWGGSPYRARPRRSCPTGYPWSPRCPRR